MPKRQKRRCRRKVAADAAAAKEKEALEAGVEAVVYGYPLVIMDVTRRKMTTVAKRRARPCADQPVRQRARVPGRVVQGRVRANADTLYSTAWLDLAKEPIRAVACRTPTAATT